MAAGRCERHARATVHSQAARSIQSIRSIARWRNTRASSIPTSRGLDRSTQRTIQTTGALHRLTARAAVSSFSKFAVEGSIPAITAHARPSRRPTQQARMNPTSAGARQSKLMTQSRLLHASCALTTRLLRRAIDQTRITSTPRSHEHRKILRVHHTVTRNVCGSGVLTSPRCKQQA